MVHDLAPGAGLAFHTALGGQQNFAQGIRDLATQAGASVIVDDASYPDEPFFNDGVITRAVNDVYFHQDAVYVTAVAQTPPLPRRRGVSWGPSPQTPPLPGRSGVSWGPSPQTPPLSRRRVVS